MIAPIVGATVSHRDGQTGYFEGGGYVVTWAMGHLIGLKSPREMGFDGSALPMIPPQWDTKVLERPEEKGKGAKGTLFRQAKLVSGLFEKSDEIIVATDAGREGELIFRLIYEHFGCRKPFRRLWISSLTDEAIRKGLKEMKDGSEYDSLSDAAHQRQRADWLIGMNASTALKKASGFEGTLSLGRVQTPTLAMICARQEQFENFVPTPYWQTAADTHKGTAAFRVQSEKKFATQTECDAATAAVIAARTLKVLSAETRRVTTPPPLLFDLTALQREANTRYGMTAAQTLAVAQKLYETKLISYPRTGSRYVPEDVFRTIPSLLEKAGALPEFAKHAAALKGKALCRRSVDDKKVTDHHALLPTGTEPAKLEGRDEQIYRMIVSRMFESFGENSLSDSTSVTLEGGGVKFRAHGSVITYPGWKGVCGTASAPKNDDDEESVKLPPLTAGETLPVDGAETLRKTDKPLPLYTDSSLLGEMETCGKKIDDDELRESMKDCGLGTPATRAAIIETLIRRNYVVRDGKKLLSAPLGKQVWLLVRDRKISDVKVTGEWERDLGKIEKGGMASLAFTERILDFTREIVGDLTGSAVRFEGVTSTGETIRRCPICGREMKHQKYTISCPAEEGGCGLSVPRVLLGKKLSASVLDALFKDGATPMVDGFVSKAGKRFSARLVLDREKKTVIFDFPKPVESGALICPSCGRPLEKNGARFVCSCGFEVWGCFGGTWLTEEQMKSLLGGGTVELKGLLSKDKKKRYNARLVMDMFAKQVKPIFF